MEDWGEKLPLRLKGTVSPLKVFGQELSDLEPSLRKIKLKIVNR